MVRALNRNPKKVKNNFECAWCKKRLPSPEAAEAHLQKRHEGNGYIVYRGNAA